MFAYMHVRVRVFIIIWKNDRIYIVFVMQIPVLLTYILLKLWSTYFLYSLFSCLFLSFHFNTLAVKKGLRFVHVPPKTKF